MDVFVKIFEQGGFGGISVSGPGSDLPKTRIIREKIPRLLRRYKVKSILDVPCGDVFWMRHLFSELETIGTQYVGADIVSKLVEQNTAQFVSPGSQREFILCDAVTSKLPRVDLIMCRDMLVHLSNEQVLAALANFKASGSRYLLTTIFPARTNINIPTGQWRPINLCLPPFSLPPPIKLILEQCNEEGGAWIDKSLGLWELNPTDNRSDDC